MQESFIRLGRWVLAIVLPGVVVLSCSGRPVLKLFGPGFEAGALWLGLLAAANGLSSFVGLAETAIMVQRPALNLANSAVTTIVHLLVSLFFISRWGATGAAMGMVVVYVLYGVLRLSELRILFGWRPHWRSLLRPFLATGLGLVPALAVRAVAGGWLAEIGAGVAFLAAYLLTWKVLGLEESDREVLRELRHRRKRPASDATDGPKCQRGEPRGEGGRVD